MPHTTMKNVRFSENQRLDLEDMLALSSLKDLDIQEVIEAVGEPGPNGRVFYGLSGTAGAGLTFDIVSEDGVALSPMGDLLIRPAGTTNQLTLSANAINYVHAYLATEDTDVETRRFQNVGVQPPVSFEQSTATRTAKVVAFHVTTAALGTPSLAGFSTSDIIGGVSRPLVALYAVTTGAGGVTSAVDFRPMWMVNGAVGSTTDELPMVIGATPGDRGVKGPRSAFRALAHMVRLITGETLTPAWWTAPVSNLRTLADAALKAANNIFTGINTFSGPATNISVGNIGNLRTADLDSGIVDGLVGIGINNAGTLQIGRPTKLASFEGNVQFNSADILLANGNPRFLVSAGLAQNPASTAPQVNALTPMNLPKAWGTIIISAGPTANVVAGFNVASLNNLTITTLDVANDTVTVLLAAAMQNTNYCVITSNHQNIRTANPIIDSTNQFRIVIEQGAGGEGLEPGIRLMFVVFGQQG